MSLVCSNKQPPYNRKQRLVEAHFAVGTSPRDLIERFFQGDTSAIPSKQGQFLDNTIIPVESAQIMDLQLRAKNAYDSLPQHVRDRLRTPRDLLRFLGDARNRPEAEKLGLLKASIETPPPPPPKEAGAGGGGNMMSLDVTVPTDSKTKDCDMVCPYRFPGKICLVTDRRCLRIPNRCSSMIHRWRMYYLGNQGTDHVLRSFFRYSEASRYNHLEVF